MITQGHTIETDQAEVRPERIDPVFFSVIHRLANEKNQDLMGKIIDHFVSDSTRVMEIIRQAVAASDAGLIMKNAHYMKSGCANLGARKLSELFKALEDCGRFSSFNEAFAIFNWIEEEHKLVVEELKAFSKGRVDG